MAGHEDLVADLLDEVGADGLGIVATLVVIVVPGKAERSCGGVPVVRTCVGGTYIREMER